MASRVEALAAFNNLEVAAGQDASTRASEELRSLQRWAEEGDARAQFQLGVRYASGKGVAAELF
jgi:TPR repeat protein